MSEQQDPTTIELEAGEMGEISLELRPETTAEQWVDVNDIAVGSDVDESVPDYSRQIDIIGLVPGESVEIVIKNFDSVVADLSHTNLKEDSDEHGDI